MNLHDQLVKSLHQGLDNRVQRGVDSERLTQSQLAKLSGIAQPNLSAIMHGKPATEATWQKLFDVAWPDESGEG